MRLKVPIFFLRFRQKIIYNVADFILVMVQQVSSFLGDWISGYNELLDKIMDFVEKLSTNINSLMQLSLDDITEWMRQQVNQLTKLVKGIIEYVKANKDKWKEALAYATHSIQGNIYTLSITHLSFRFSFGQEVWLNLNKSKPFQSLLE